MVAAPGLDLEVLGKRIIPVLGRLLDGAIPPPQLADLNYIFFYEEPRSPGSGFGTGLLALVTALNPTFATRGIEAAKLEVFRGVRSKGRHHTGRCHGAATSTEAILGDG